MPSNNELDAMAKVLGHNIFIHLCTPDQIVVMRLTIAAKQADALQRIANCENGGFIDVRTII